ncbi:MAG: SCP2 sterol-binding domain-containing protein [Proteobacteria bacterium]|nr:SCP2 sterol-binding domain-containing protein [Pseudomonadota bacterium]
MALLIARTCGMEQFLEVPVLPGWARLGAGLLPASLLESVVARIAKSTLRRHPGLLDRLDSYAATTVLIDPTDLPFGFYLTPSCDVPVTVLRRPLCRDHAASIAGPFAALVAMLHGRLDGDALFFSRDIAIEGDTSAILALRNALDDAEIDLAREFAALFGPMSAFAEIPIRAVVPLVERFTGAVLSRREI